MKLEINVLVFVLLFSQFANAQFSIGIEGGISLSNVRSEGIEEFDNKPIANYFFGLAPQYSVNDKMSIKYNVLYSVKGYQVENGGGIGNSKFRYIYLVLSPQFEYRLHRLFGVSIGPYSGLKLEEEQKMPGSDWSSTKEFDIIKSTDYGIALSVNTYYNNLYFKLAYDFGVQDIVNITFTDNNGQPIEVENFTRSFQIGIGYLLSFN